VRRLEECTRKFYFFTCCRFSWSWSLCLKNISHRIFLFIFFNFIKSVFRILNIRKRMEYLTEMLNIYFKFCRMS